MTETMAIDFMENEIRCIQRASYCDRDCAKCHLVREEEPLLEAYGMAVRALEKQVAKKPIYSRLYATTPNMNCSVCGKTLLTDYPKFCSDCGQKIDWSDEE